MIVSEKGVTGKFKKGVENVKNSIMKSGTQEKVFGGCEQQEQEGEVREEDIIDATSSSMLKKELEGRQSQIPLSAAPIIPAGPTGEEGAAEMISKFKKQPSQCLLLGNLDLERVDAEWLNGVDVSVVQELQLSFNKLENASNFFLEKFCSLQVLHLQANKLTRFDSGLFMLTNLKELDLSGNMIQEIPREVSKLTKLTKLCVPNNKISKISPMIGHLKKLEEMDLNGNALESVPHTFGNLVSLETLDLSFCCLKQLPEEVCFLTRLIQLNLGGNKLTSLPKSIGYLKRVVNCNVADNSLKGEKN